MADELNPILNYIQSSLGSGDPFESAIASNAQQIMGAGEQAVTALKTASQATDLVVAQKGAGELSAQNEAQNFKASMGGTEGDPNYLIGMLTQNFQHNTREALAARKQLEAMDALNPITSPLQWLAAKFTENDVIDKHNFHAQAAAQDEASINEIANTTSNVAQMAKATATTVTKETLAAEMEAKRAADDAKIMQLKQQNLMHDTNAIQVLQQGRMNELDQFYKAEHFKMQQAQFAESQEQHAWMREDAAANREMRKLQFEGLQEERRLRQEEKARILADKELTLSRFRLGYKVLGGEGDISEGTMKQMIANPALKKVVDNITGSGIEKAVTGRTVIAQDPGEAFVTIGQAGLGAKWAGSNAKPTFDKLSQYAADATKLPEYGAAKNAAEREVVLSNYINKQVAAEAPKWANNAEHPSSLYDAPDLVTLAASVPSIKDSPLYTKVLLPLVEATNDSSLNFSKVDGAVRAAVATGKITEQQAITEVSNLYNAAKLSNNVMRQFTSFSIPPQIAYNIQAGRDGFGFENKYTFDVSKPEEYAKYLQFMKYKNVVGSAPLIQPLFTGVLQAGM